MPKPCDHCETEYTPRQYAQRFCSYLCGYTYRNRGKAEIVALTPRVETSCVRCGGDLSHTRSNAIYCSKTCKSMDHTFKHRGKTRVASTARRRFIYERDAGSCYVCNAPVPSDAFELDHLVPVAAGGTSEDFNLAVSCRFCNRSKGAKISTSAMQKLRELVE